MELSSTDKQYKKSHFHPSSKSVLRHALPNAVLGASSSIVPIGIGIVVSGTAPS